MPWFHVHRAVPSPQESLCLVAKGKWYTNEDIAALQEEDPFNFPYENATKTQVKKAFGSRVKNKVLVKFRTGTLKGEKGAARRLRDRVLYMSLSQIKNAAFIPEFHISKPSDVPY